MTTTTHHLIAVAKIPTKGQALITYTHALIAALTNNAHIQTPNPPITTLSGLLTTFETAEAATVSRTKGTVGTRNAAKAALVSAIRTEVATIQAAADADPENAQAIITSASLSVRKVPIRVKAPFAVKEGSVSGTAVLTVKSAGRNSSYDWQMSVDGGKTWTDLPSTTRVKTTVAALPTAATVMFRFRSLTPAGQGDWSQPISLLVK
jgi:hypothetical protein